MTEEEKLAAEKAAKEEGDEQSQKITKLEESNANLVDEIKNDRIKRQEKDEEIELLKTTIKQSVVSANADPEESKIQNVVNQVLEANNVSRAKQNKTVALEKFVTDNKDFHPDNDPTGLKRAALEKKLKSFNTDGITEIEDFVKVIGDAKTLLGQDTSLQSSTEQEIKNPYSSTSKGASSPKEALDKDLDPREQKLIKQSGYTKEAYLALKVKMPAFVEGLLKNVQ